MPGGCLRSRLNLDRRRIPQRLQCHDDMTGVSRAVRRVLGERFQDEMVESLGKIWADPSAGT